MRIGKPGSSSFRRNYARQRLRRIKSINRLCLRLDHLVGRAERLHSGVTRQRLLQRADGVREKLRVLDH